MKLKYIFTALVAALTLAVGCEDSIETYLDEVKVSSSYVAIPAEGGSKTITVNAKAEWSFGDIPEWVTVTPTSGVAGETEVTFKAEATTSTNEAMLYLNCDGESQIINVLQMTEKVELPITTCAEFNSKGEDGKSYRVKGTVTGITSTTYGNMYINDGTGEAYVYGTLDASGAEKNFSSLGIEVGDIVTVEGPRKTYNGTIELVNVTVISIEKSLIKVDSVSVNEPLPLEGGEFKAYLTCKGDGVSVTVPDDAKSWLSVTSIETSGTNATVVFNAAANQLGDRATTLVFSTVSGGKTYSAQTELEQKGAILAVSVAEFLEAAVSPAQYRLTGTVTKISVSEQYNNADITLADALGNSVLVYRMKPAEGKITDLTISEGDKLTVVGQRGEYKGTPQMVSGVYESHIHYTPATISQFLAAEVSDIEYIVTGKIVSIKEISASYKNATLTISDDTGASLYIFRMKAAEGGLAIEEIGLKVGDVLTVIGKRGEYNGSAQMVNGYYVSYEAGSDEPEDPDPENPTPSAEEYSIDLKYTLGSNAYDDGVATVNGIENVKVLKFGTAKAAGDLTVTVPAGSKRVSFYAVAWKNSATTLDFSTGGISAGTIAIEANDGATANTPYTLTVTGKDKYEIKVDTALPADMDFKITTAEGAKTRAILFGLKAYTE